MKESALGALKGALRLNERTLPFLPQQILSNSPLSCDRLDFFIEAVYYSFRTSFHEVPSNGNWRMPCLSHLQTWVFSFAAYICIPSPSTYVGGA